MDKQKQLMYVVDNMLQGYKNIPVPVEAHTIIFKEAHRREMSITKLLTAWAKQLKKAQNKRISSLSTPQT